MTPILFHTTPCAYTPTIRAVANRLRIQLELKEAPLVVLELLPWGNYERSPVLVDGERAIEDWRAIIRYLDERFGDGQLTKLPPLIQMRVFELCDEIDQRILAPAAREWVEQPKSWYRKFREFFPSRHSSLNEKNLLESLATELIQISSRPELNAAEFEMARLMLQGAREFINDLQESVKGTSVKAA